MAHPQGATGGTTASGAQLSSPIVQTDAIEDRLKNLADLHAAGDLTDDEYAQAKANLLRP